MFIVYGPGITDPVPLEKLFAQPTVENPGIVSPKQPIKREKGAYQTLSAYQSTQVKKRYQTGEIVDGQHPCLRASQIMTAPVASLQAHATALEALNMLDSNEFQHIPVMSLDNQLVGMISDRDIVHCMCGSGTVCVHCSGKKQEILVDRFMKDSVLTASMDTDARHIARLFVEQRIGAIPVVENRHLTGIISRSDILRAVMRHFDLNLWT